MSTEKPLEQTDKNKNYRAICCERIPELFLDKLVAKKHFSKFGKINRFIFRPKRFMCTVEYETDTEGKRAFREAGNFNGTEFIVKYAEHEEAHVQNTEEWVDPEVQSELEAMSANQRFCSNLRQNTALPLNRISNLNRPTNKAQVSTSKINKMVNELPQINTMLKQELEALLRKAAFSEEDKYRVLEARDKLLRMTSVKQTDIKKAVATRGTCPDMCPEKERLMREFQRQVSIYEMADEEEGRQKTISHSKAIKQYSRSSADQEVPLAHELRPESVLQMTMLYLMHYIVDLCDSPQTALKDWFHFVWDRTRSIRKDITQQELCSLAAVELVEQCARFHIHCAARLVAEEPSVFDKKINAENLTKCLQSLKYMYHDLRLKGIRCPQEVEFRSYIVLLNLGDSNFLWELKQLPQCIQKAPEIKKAIAFYNALQNNNYVRFFNMIKAEETSYLSACILLGYFNKLRLKAMEAIMKAHNAHKMAVYLPLSYLADILAFEDVAGALNFLTCHGLQCDEEDDRVFLERLGRPDLEYVMDRALKLVESKRRVSVGECVCGHALPSTKILDQHEPHNSFDANGLLKAEAWSAKDQLRGEATKVKTCEKINLPPKSSSDANLFKMPLVAPFTSPKQLPKAQQFKFGVRQSKEESLHHSPVGSFKFSGDLFKSKSDTSHSSSTLFKEPASSHDGLNTAQTHFFTNILTADNTKKPLVHSAFATPTDATTNLFGLATEGVKGGFLRDNVFQHYQEGAEIPKQSVMEATPLEEIKTRERQLQRAQVLHQQQVEEERGKLKILEREKQRRQLKMLERLHQAERENELLRKSLEEAADQLFNSLNIEVQDAEIAAVANEELIKYQLVENAAENLSAELLHTVTSTIIEELAYAEVGAQCYKQMLLNKYFLNWLKHCRKKKERRQIMEESPLWVTTNTQAHYAEQLRHPSEHSNMMMIKRYRLGQACNFKQLLWSGSFARSQRQTVDLFDLIGQHLVNTSTQTGLAKRKYFKLVLSVPSDEEELPGFETLCNKWLMKNIERAHSTETEPFVHGIKNNVALCVRKLKGIKAQNEQGGLSEREADHCDAIVCFVSGVNLYEASRKRIEHLLNLANNYKQVPLAVIAYNCAQSEEELAELLNLQHLLDHGLISDFACCGCQLTKNEFSFSHTIIAAIHFVTKHSHAHNSDRIESMAMLKFINILEICLGEEMWRRWNVSSLENPVFNKICSMPEHVVNVFNQAVQRVDHMTHKDFSEMPEFPHELKEFVPLSADVGMPLTAEYFPLNWKSLQRSHNVGDFLNVLKMPAVKHQVPANVEDLKAFLLNYACDCVPEDDICAAEAAQSAILELVIQLQSVDWENSDPQAHLTSLNFLKIIKPIAFARINYHLKTIKRELIMLPIVYSRKDLNDYQTVPWWLDCNVLDLLALERDIAEQTERTVAEENNDGHCRTELSQVIISAIIEKAERICQNIETEKENKNDSSKANNSCYRLKRNLDESLYEFELAQKIGCYNTAHVQQVTNDLDKTVDELEQKAEHVMPTKKRKHDEVEVDGGGGIANDMDLVVNRALALVQQMEELEDRKSGMRSSDALLRF